jgi:hypothetical protein
MPLEGRAFTAEPEFGSGTKRTSVDVRSSVAIGGKPDMAPKVIS